MKKIPRLDFPLKPIYLDLVNFMQYILIVNKVQYDNILKNGRNDEKSRNIHKENCKLSLERRVADYGFDYDDIYDEQVWKKDEDIGYIKRYLIRPYPLPEYYVLEIDLRKNLYECAVLINDNKKINVNIFHTYFTAEENEEKKNKGE